MISTKKSFYKMPKMPKNKLNYNKRKRKRKSLMSRSITIKKWVWKTQES